MVEWNSKNQGCPSCNLVSCSNCLSQCPTCHNHVCNFCMTTMYFSFFWVLICRKAIEPDKANDIISWYRNSPCLHLTELLCHECANVQVNREWAALTVTFPRKFSPTRNVTTVAMSPEMIRILVRNHVSFVQDFFAKGVFTIVIIVWHSMVRMCVGVVITTCPLSVCCVMSVVALRILTLWNVPRAERLCVLTVV